MRSLVFMAALLLLGQTPALAWQQSTSSQDAGLHWPGSCVSVHLNIQGSADVSDAELLGAVKSTLQTWSEVECSDFTFQWAGITNILWAGYKEGLQDANLILFRETDWPYGQRPVAFTSVTYDPATGVIVDADIEMNGVDHRFTVYPTLHPGRIDIENTLTHEAGHILGLDHSPVKEATMFSHAAPGESEKRSLSQDDREGLCAIYPSTDEGPGCTEVETTALIVDDPYGEEPDYDTGCGVGAGCSGPWALLLLGALMLLRRRSAALLFLLLTLAPLQAGAWVYYQTDGGEDVFWRPEACTMTYLVDNHGLEGIPAGQEVAHVRSAFQAWSEVDCSDVVVQMEALTDAPSIQAIQGLESNQVVFVDKGWEYDPAFAMLTIVSYVPTTGEIKDVDIGVNNHWFDFSLCEGEDEDSDLVDYRHAMLHEAGHFFGLAHFADAVMDSDGEFSCASDKPHELTDEDKDGLCDHYDRSIWACTDDPPETSPEAAEVADVSGSDLTSGDAIAEGGGGGGGGCCSLSGFGDPGLVLLLLTCLAFLLGGRRLTSRC